MSVKSEGDHTDSWMGEDGVSRRSSLGNRSWSSSLTRSRKGNSRIATVKPVTKCLSSSEEELSKLHAKASPRKDLGSTSPGIARLLSKDVAGMEKDAIVAELEKCLTELESEDSSYRPLVDEYNRIEEERDELANELENAFEELEGYMHHVKDVEAEKKEIEMEKEELSKEVESLKFCLTSRQQIQETGLRKDKLTLESQLKEITEENKSMKEQISELLDERQSLIESLLNLHSAEVDDVIQTRSRSCSTVSMESISSSALRTEFSELRDRVQEAEEAEVKLTDELVHCRALLKEALDDKVSLEDENEDLSDELAALEKTNQILKNDLDQLETQIKRNKDKRVNKATEELQEATYEPEKQTCGKQSSGGEVSENITKLEEKIDILSSELFEARNECDKQTVIAADNGRKLSELKIQANEEKAALNKEIEQLEERLDLSKSNEKMLIETENQLRRTELVLSDLQKDKKNTEKQMAEIGEKLLNERAKGRQEKSRLEEEVAKVKVVLEANQSELRKLRILQNEFHKVDNELKDVSMERDELRKQLAGLNKDLSSNADSFNLEKRKLEREILDLNTKNRTFSDTKARLCEAKIELEQTTISYDKVVSEKDNLTAEMSDLKSKYNKERTLLINERKDLEQFVEHLESRIEKLKVVQQNLTKAEAEQENINKRMDILQEEKRVLETCLEEEKSRRLAETAELENRLKISADNIDEQKKRIDEISVRENKLKENEFKVRRLEQSLSDTMNDQTNSKKKSEERLQHEVGLFKIEQQKLTDQIHDLQDKLKAQEEGRKSLEDIKFTLERQKSEITELRTENLRVKKLCRDFENLASSLRKENSTIQAEASSFSAEIIILKTDLERTCKQLKTALNDLEVAGTENKDLKNAICELEFTQAKQKEDREDAKNVATSSLELQVKQEFEKEGNSHLCPACTDFQTEIDEMKTQIKKLLQDLENSRECLVEANHAKNNLQASFVKLSKDISTVRSENVVLKETFEAVKAENNELNEKIRTDSNGFESTIHELKNANEDLKRVVITLRDELSKAQEDYKITVDRTRSVEENSANTLRSLKARKNELQMQLARTVHEKEDLEKEAMNLKDQLAKLHVVVSSTRNNANAESEIKNLRQNLNEAEEQTRGANLKSAEMELQNRECTRKLHESEALILDLQRAVARANDVAMEKALESSRSKRLLEKKIEKILKENAVLRKQLRFDGPTIIEAEKHSRSHSVSDFELHSPPLNGIFESKKDIAYEERVKQQQTNYNPVRESSTRSMRKQSVDELHSSSLQTNKDIALSRSGSAPLAKRLSVNNQQGQLVRTTVTARSLSPPVKYFSDTDSLGSKPESNDGDNPQTPSTTRKPAPPSYYETKRNEKEQQSFSQPERVHRPILLKEIPVPNLSPSSLRRSPRVTSPNTRKVNNDGKKRMEHWV